jgi:hypothetical protein
MYKAQQVSSYLGDRMRCRVINQKWKAVIRKLYAQKRVPAIWKKNCVVFIETRRRCYEVATYTYADRLQQPLVL